MVEIALGSRSFDLGYQFSLAGIDGEYMSAVKKGNNLISELGGTFGTAIIEAANKYRDNLPGNGSIKPPKPTTGNITTTGTTSSTTPTAKPSTGSSGTTPVNPGASARPGFEDVSFDGHTFTFATPLNTTDGWADYEVHAEEDGAGILDAAIVQRNNLLRQHYDCSVMAVDVENGTLQDDFNTNQNRIDILLTRYNMQSKANGDYYNYYDLDIDFVYKLYN